VGPQCFCFLATKAHFSSSWTSWVAGGKSHEFVVGLAGVGARLLGVADDGVLIDAGQAGGLSDAATVLEVLEDGQGRLRGQPCTEQGSPLPLGETGLAGATGQQATLLVPAIAEGDSEVPSTSQAIVGAMRVLAAEGVKVVHERGSPGRRSGSGQQLL
jgi:hypothetical protein